MLNPIKGLRPTTAAARCEVCAKRLGAKRRVSWNDYPGVQAWQL
jgi:hypothetical protein